MKEINLSTGKKCPRCGCDSLEEYDPFRQKYQKHYCCVAMCGMDFGLSRVESGRIKIGYDKENEPYLQKRFNIRKMMGITHKEER